MARLTREVRQKLIEYNEGFSTRTNYERKNSREERTYTIRDGKLNIRATGKTSWSDSRYDEEWVADEEEIHRFIYKYQYKINTDGL